MTQKQGRNTEKSQKPTALQLWISLNWLVIKGPFRVFWAMDHNQGLQSASFFKYNVQFDIRMNAYGNGH